MYLYDKIHRYRIDDIVNTRYEAKSGESETLQDVNLVCFNSCGSVVHETQSEFSLLISQHRSAVKQRE